MQVFSVPFRVTAITASESSSLVSHNCPPRAIVAQLTSISIFPKLSMHVEIILFESSKSATEAKLEIAVPPVRVISDTTSSAAAGLGFETSHAAGIVAPDLAERSGLAKRF